MKFTKTDAETFETETVEVDIPKEIYDMLRIGFQNQNEYLLTSYVLPSEFPNQVWFAICKKREVNDPPSKKWRVTIEPIPTT